MLTDADLAQLAAAGIARAEAERQLALLRQPPPPARLARPATLGDGIVRLDAARWAELLRLGEGARDAGRLTKFVPASGAATRMFRELIAWRATGAAERVVPPAPEGADARAVAAFVEALPRLALADALAEALGTPRARLAEDAATKPLAPLLASLLDAGGLEAARLPKALLPFHRGPDGRPRSAFVEQLFEGLGYLADAEGVARFHFTVPPGWRKRFERELAVAMGRLPAGVRLRVGFSEQSSATDTLALDAAGQPARTEDGALLLRPSGHGALLDNLEASGADLALVKNIDNILPAARHAEIARWQLVLAGLLVEAEAEGGARDQPLRVAAVVPNAGEPGGGPFWVLDADGAESLQIVEASQVDTTRPDQAAIWRASTHFNPVDLAVALRSPAGLPFRLAEFVDPAAAFVSRKSEGGRELTVLERPGLWNGAMARWRTIFVELPLWTFAPVKSVLDLARPEHAAATPGAR